jgi:hypothetical protein
VPEAPARPTEREGRTLLCAPSPKRLARCLLVLSAGHFCRRFVVANEVVDRLNRIGRKI